MMGTGVLVRVAAGLLLTGVAILATGVRSIPEPVSPPVRGHHVSTPEDSLINHIEQRFYMDQLAEQRRGR